MSIFTLNEREADEACVFFMISNKMYLKVGYGKK